MHFPYSSRDRYAYAVIGLEIFGTVASPNDDQQLRDFSTFAYSFVALFQLTVSNNWNDILCAIRPIARAGSASLL